MPSHLAIAEQMIAHNNALDSDAYVALMTDDACEAVYRGDVLRILSKPVTLNSFQGPSGRKPGACRRGTHPAVWLANSCSGGDAKWVLKRVQDDDDFSGVRRG